MINSILHKAIIQISNKINKLKQQSMIQHNNYLGLNSNNKNDDRTNNKDAAYHTPRSRSSKRQENLQQTKSVFYSTFSNHAQQCLCKQCLCGRHLCKISSPSPSLTLSTTYKDHYPPKKSSKYRQNLTRPFSAQQKNSPLLTSSSTYKGHYNQLHPDQLIRPKPKDLLSSGGPAMRLSMYAQQFPGHRGKNQYVPVNPELFRGGLAFEGQTSYSKQYGRLQGQSAEKAKPADQFKMGGSWLGESSYRSEYKNPSSHVSPHKGKRQQDRSTNKNRDQTPNRLRNTSSHFKTTYLSDFKQKDGSVCPAVSLLESETKKIAKSNFKQNSNFKSIDRSLASLGKTGSFWG